MAATLADASAPDTLHATFLSLLPRIVSHGIFAFRAVRCPHRRADAIQELVAIAWLGFVRAARQGKDPSTFAWPLAKYAARRVCAGRHLCGAESIQDALASRAHLRHNFVARYSSDLAAGYPAVEALMDNTATPPPDQAAFRLDFPRWRAGYGERDQAMIDELMAGERTGDVAARHGISAGRVAQKRVEIHADWLRFNGEWIAED
jgi:hypothetical protein